MKHVFFVPCDSHGLQLLVKDLLSLPHYRDINEKAQTIVKAFKNAPLQLSHLRAFQRQIYKKEKALVLSVITRWGTHAKLAESVYNNKDALRAFVCSDKSNKLNPKAAEYIRDPLFWAELDELRDLLHSIDEQLQMSESNKSNLGRVAPHWEQIHTHLEGFKESCSDLKEYLDPNNKGIISIHYIANLRWIFCKASPTSSPYPSCRILSYPRASRSSFRSNGSDYGCIFCSIFQFCL